MIEGELPEPGMQAVRGSFEIADSIRFEPGQGGFERAVLTHESGARCEVYLYGAHVASWRPRQGRELLFLSEKAEFRQGKAIRGGIPIIFPQFSGQGPLPAHGFARNTLWQVASTSRSPAGDVSITLSLASSEQTRAVWKHDFVTTLTVTLGERLTLVLATRNAGGEALQFQNAFHTYFNVEDARTAAILGLEGTRFVDFLLDGKTETESRDRVTVDQATDRVYADAPDLIRIAGAPGNGSFAIRKTGMKDAVVWNPWKEKCAALKDMVPTDYLKMLCVETGNVETRVTLQPGERWESGLELSYQSE